MPKRKMEKPNEEDRLARILKDARSLIINEPTIQYNVGDRVQRGSVKESVVTEVIDGGKIYKLHEIVIDNNYGRPVASERDDYVAWNDIEPYRTPEQNKQVPILKVEDELQISYAQRDIYGLLTTYYHFHVDMEPDYQRGNVWELEDKVKLIDSIFNNVDIGKFVFIHKTYASEKLYEILDGKQRLTAIVEFLEGRFEYKGMKYRDMHPRDRSHFDSYPVSWGEARMANGSKEVPNKFKYQYFLKLNVGGKPQDPKHIEHVRKLLEQAGE